MDEINMSQKSFFEGNASTSKKVRRIQSKFWKCNYHLKDSDSLENVFESIESIFRPLTDKFIFGEEYGESQETPHIEGYLIFSKKTEFNSIMKLFKFSDLQKSCKKNAGAGIEYCGKEGNKLLKHGLPKELKKLACEDNLFDWQELLCGLMDQEPDDRSIYWIIGKDGNEGKTTFCKYLHRRYGAICLSGKCADMKNGIIEYQKANEMLPEYIVLNIPRSFNSDYLSYTGIEEIKDMFFYSGKYEGGMVDGNSPHLFIFSNCYPDIDKVSKDRWKIYLINKGWIDVEKINGWEDWH